MTAPTIPAGLGQVVYLMSVQANMHIYAVVTDPAVPNLTSITVEVNADEATAVAPGLIGATGANGEPQFALSYQNTILGSVNDLPDDLSDADFGDYYFVESFDQNGNVASMVAYVWWFNSAWRIIPFGTVGPAGPYPVVSPDVILIDPDMQSYVSNTGTVSNPSWTFYLAVPRGIPGPAATLAGCPDVTMFPPPTIGQVLGFNGLYTQGFPQWGPMTVGAMNPLPYTVPESAFTSFNGIASATQLIATFAIPSQPWPWKPIVFGQMLAGGIELSLNPFLVGVDVLLGDPSSGTLVGSGFGNSFGAPITVLPQTSSPTNTNAAITPTNSTGLVQANHTGNAGTLYVNLNSQGMAGVFSFTAENSQLFVLVVPIGTEGAVDAGIYGQLNTKVSLTAWTITQG